MKNVEKRIPFPEEHLESNLITYFRKGNKVKMLGGRTWHAKLFDLMATRQVTKVLARNGICRPLIIKELVIKELVVDNKMSLVIVCNSTA